MTRGHGRHVRRLDLGEAGLAAEDPAYAWTGVDREGADDDVASAVCSNS